PARLSTLSLHDALPISGALEVLRWVSGIAIVGWVLRALAFVVGARSSAEVRLAKNGIQVRTRDSLLGRVVRERDETWTLDALERDRKSTRLNSSHVKIS